MRLLPTIDFPEDLKRLPRADLVQLCAEIREFLIESVSSTGGHLSSNLGVVELTVALHSHLRHRSREGPASRSTSRTRPTSTRSSRGAGDRFDDAAQDRRGSVASRASIRVRRTTCSTCRTPAPRSRARSGTCLRPQARRGATRSRTIALVGRRGHRRRAWRSRASTMRAPSLDRRPARHPERQPDVDQPSPMGALVRYFDKLRASHRWVETASREMLQGAGGMIPLVGHAGFAKWIPIASRRRSSTT